MDTQKPTSLAHIALLVMAAAGGILWATGDDSPSSSSAVANTSASSASECASDLDCWAKRWQTEADVACGRFIERLAANNFEWSDSWLDSKFSRVRWLDESQKTLSYVGDKVKFQNGFGAWIIHSYQCDYDPSTRTVLDARAWPGQI